MINLWAVKCNRGLTLLSPQQKRKLNQTLMPVPSAIEIKKLSLHIPVISFSFFLCYRCVSYTRLQYTLANLAYQLIIQKNGQKDMRKYGKYIRVGAKNLSR